MTYSVDFRKQVVKSINEKNMSIRQASAFYDVSKTTIQRWLKDISIKLSRDKAPTKIPDMILLKDIEKYPNDYQYQRAERLGCSSSGVGHALRRLGIN